MALSIPEGLRVLITRPRADAEELARHLEGRGHVPQIEPLLTIEPIRGTEPRLDGVQAIVVTSANAILALSPAAKELPVFAVGAATAERARGVGCRQVAEAEGDANDLARLIVRRCAPSAGALLHLAGADVRAGLAEALGAAGFELRRQTVYRAVAATGLSAPTAQALRRGAIDAVLLFSPRTARIFVSLIVDARLEAAVRGLAAVCLSGAVARSCAALPWSRIATAVRPARDALVEALEATRVRC